MKPMITSETGEGTSGQRAFLKDAPKNPTDQFLVRSKGKSGKEGHPLFFTHDKKKGTFKVHGKDVPGHVPVTPETVNSWVNDSAEHEKFVLRVNIGRKYLGLRRHDLVSMMQKVSESQKASMH